MRKITVIILTLSTLLVACEGTYLGGLLVVEHHDARSKKFIPVDPNTRSAKWGECDSWHRVMLASDTDVDTAYNLLIRSGAIYDIYSVPQTNNQQIDQQLIEAWRDPVEKPHLSYYMPPRWMIVHVDDYEQHGAVAFEISKRNRGNQLGSFIDVEYCRGGEYEIGFHVQEHKRGQFEHNLINKFEKALSANYMYKRG